MNREQHRGLSAFELLLVGAMILVLQGLIKGAAGPGQQIIAQKREEGEIAAMSAAIQNFFNDNGDYPRTPNTDALDPRMYGNPTSGQSRRKYESACIDLYRALSGDHEPAKHPDFKPEQKQYYGFTRTKLSIKKDAQGDVKEVNFISDPWGNAYGYSTARSKAERQYQEDLRRRTDAVRPTRMPGYNGTFDLWSTAGSARNLLENGEQLDAKNWAKNW